MLFGLLAASALGMAVASSTRRDGNKALSDALFGEAEQLALPFMPEAPEQEPLPEGIPDLFEIFDMKRTIYVIFIGDGYLIGADEDEEDAIEQAKGHGEDDPETTQINVSRIQLPSHIADRLLEEGYSDGYEAQNVVATHGGELQTIWEWTVFDEDFEDWPEEMQTAHRERIVNQFDIEFLPEGSLVYTSTELPERIEDEDVEDLEHLFVVRDQQAATEQLLLPHHKPRPLDRRLLTYRVLRPHLVQVVDDDDLAYAEQILGVDFGDDEGTHQQLNRLRDDGVDVRSIEARGKILLRNITDDDLELVDVQRLHPDGESP